MEEHGEERFGSGEVEEEPRSVRREHLPCGECGDDEQEWTGKHKGREGRVDPGTRTAAEAQRKSTTSTGGFESDWGVGRT